MVLFWLTLVLALSGSNAEGQFRILHSPDSLRFKSGAGTTWESKLKEIFAAAFGLSIPYDSEWVGLEIMDPFNTPEAAVAVHIDGVPELEVNFGLKSEIFPLLVDEYEPNTFEGVKLRIKQRFDVGSNELVNFELSDVTKFNKIKSALGKLDVANYKMDNFPMRFYLKHAVIEDRQFLNELRTLRAVIEQIRDGVLIADKFIDFYNFRFRTLHTLSDYYGPSSNETKEAKQLLRYAVQDLGKAFVKAYDGSVLVTVVTTEVSHSRRSARAVTTTPLGNSKWWPYKWPQLNQEKKSKEAQIGGKQESDVETVDVKRYRGYFPSNTKSSTESPEKISTQPPGFFLADDLDPAFSQPSFRRQAKEEKLPIILHGEAKTKETPTPEDNAAIFNLFLFFGMAFFFAMLAIIYAMMEMDPGRDTIIYRMTATRATKKDV